uniref:Cortexin domain containing 1 n=1 Tax=Anolis carolinensis TaxID=28377 RepID=A0A803TH03_ANOCA
YMCVLHSHVSAPTDEGLRRPPSTGPMEDPTAETVGDVDKGICVGFLSLMCFFLLIMMVRCAKLIVDPYTAIPTSTWEEEQFD